MNLHIITGGSRGLGEALVSYFLQQGDHVAEISRSGLKHRPGLQSYAFDLAGAASKAELMDRIFSDFKMSNYQSLTLTNNAGMVDPVKRIENLLEANILTNAMVNLVGPMMLTAAFLNKSKDFSGNRVIANVSTGVAKNPKACWAVYSATKAGLESFSETIALENAENKKIKVINYGPGIIDTEMQASIRNISQADFDDLKRFINFKKNGDLLPPQTVAQALGQLMLKKDLAQKTFTTVYDLI